MRWVENLKSEKKQCLFRFNNLELEEKKIRITGSKRTLER